MKLSKIFTIFLILIVFLLNTNVLALEGETSCISDSDCKFNEYCSDGLCKITYCDTDKQCPVNTQCFDGICYSSSAITCEETDKGKDYEQKGKIKTSYRKYPERIEEDSCNQDGTLREWFCAVKEDNSGLLQSVNYYNCPNGCKDGACIQNSEENSCIDSDNGKSYDVYGKVTYDCNQGPCVFIDACHGDLLEERFCGENSEPKTQNYNCPNGCKDGACIQNSGDSTFFKIKEIITLKDEGFGFQDYPKMFNNEVYLVVGRNSAASDVLASADVAASLTYLGRQFRSVTDGELFSLESRDIVAFSSLGKENNCINEVVQKLFDCSTLNLNNNEAILKFVKNEDKTALLIIGKESRDVRIAAKVLASYEKYKLKGTEVKIIEETNLEKSEILPDLVEGGICKGCKSEDKCLQFGIRFLNDRSNPVFCDIDSKIKLQKQNKEACQNNYECLSNSCGNSICQDINERIEGIEKELKEQRGILQRILDFFAKLFG